MSRTISGTSLNVYIETATGLILEATIDSGTIPTTASLYAPGARVLDLSSGIWYVNNGSTAVPVFNSGFLTKVVSLSAADLIAMYAAPVALIAAVPNKAIILDSLEFVITRTSTAFTGGGVVAAQYDSTANGAGTALHATLAATVVTGAAGTSYSARIPVVLSDVASTAIVGIGVYLSNATAAFAAGTGTAQVTLRYHLV